MTFRGKRFARRFKEQLKRNLKTVILKEAGPALIQRVLDFYELELYNIAPENDPTAPEYWKDDFSDLLDADLEESIQITSKGITFGIGDKEALGYDSDLAPESQDVLKTFVYILEGILGSYAWITPEIYILKKGPNSWEDWGRFGGGFLMTEDEFYAEGWDDVVTFGEVRWGFSGEGPKDIFENAYKGFNWYPFLEKAIDKTVKDLQGKKL